MQPIRASIVPTCPKRRRSVWDVSRTLDLIRERFARLKGIDPDDEDAVEKQWLLEVGRGDDEYDEDEAPRSAGFFLGEAMAFCHLYIEEGEEAGVRVQMTQMAQTLNTKARHLLRMFELSYADYEPWARSRHERGQSSFAACRFPHRHYLFCVLPAKARRSLRDLIESTETMKARFLTGLKAPAKPALRHLVAKRLTAAGLTQSEVASVIDPDGFATNKANATLSIRKLLKRGGAPLGADKPFFSFVRSGTRRFRG